MPTKINWFIAITGVLNFAGAAYEFYSGRPKMGLVYISYGVAAWTLAVI